MRRSIGFRRGGWAVTLGGAGTPRARSNRSPLTKSAPSALDGTSSPSIPLSFFFFLNDPAPTESPPLPLPAPLPTPLAPRIYGGAAIRIAGEIGTNGEVILGPRDRLWACSAPAGPALEGAQIRHGMRGALGAIDRVTVDDDIHVHTIGEADPLGICGSGLIDLLAGLLDTGVIDWTGLIRVEAREALPPKLRERVVMRGEERQVIVLRPGEAGARQEVVLTQDDVRQVQLAKGAIASGVAMLQHVASVSDETVAELMLAGGFGNYVSISSALRIGLIPPLPKEKIRYVGNAASLGAQLCLVSETERQRAESVAARIEHVSLAAHPDFERIFVEAMNFPRPG